MSLDLCKQLLVAESELNRAQLLRHGEAQTAAFQALKERAQSLHLMAFPAAGLATDIAAWLRRREGKSSRLQVVLNGAGFVASLWMAWRKAGGSPRW